MTPLLLKRVNALAMIVEGAFLFFGIRLGLHMRAARAVARANGRRKMRAER